MPVFFESGLLILIPVAFGIARKTGKSVFCYSIPLLAGLAIGHAFVPPTPGPVLVAEMLNVELCYYPWNYYWNPGNDPGRTGVWKICRK